ncbi:MAG TPA: hypothetical protein VD902_06670 [Symbiobacteriaceae bacterium]|nr:hypothetical protein [Symbiobacteriaceae bacterium]
MRDFGIRRDLLDTYFTTEALEKSPEVFRKVHTPIDRIGVDFYREGPYEPFAHEDQVTGWVLNSRGSAWGNRIFTITGETGSGKSELCQYISHRAKETKQHEPILISRSMTRLRDIVALLHRHLGLPEPDDIDEITGRPVETVRHAAVTECLLAVDSKAFQKYSGEQRQKLRSILQDVAFGRLIERAFRRYCQEVNYTGKERVLELMDFDEFENLMSGAAPFLNRAEVFPLLRSRVNDGMKRLVQLGDMTERLRKIAKRYNDGGIRPVLIMEDLTSFGFVKEDLLDYLFDLNAGNFDVVIGWTTGFEAEQLFRNPNEQVRSYMIDRMKGRFLTTSQDTRTAYFLERLHQPLVRRYLEAVRDPAVSGTIPDPFFPLNPYAVTRIFQHLLDDKGQSKRTPRLLIDVIGRVLRSDLPPWQEIEQRLLRVNLSNWEWDDRLFHWKDRHPDAVAVLKWYGHPDSGKIARKTVELLGLNWPTDLAEYLSDEPIWAEAPAEPGHAGRTVPPQPQAGQKPVGSVPAAGQGAVPPAKGGGTPPVPEPEPVKPARDPDLMELQEWLDGRDYPSRQKVKAGLAQLAGLVEDHRRIGNPRGQLEALRFDKMTMPVVMAGTNDLGVDHPAVQLQPRRDQYEYFRACIRVTSAKAAETSLLENPRLTAWAAGLMQDYCESQRRYLTQRLGMSPEDLAYHAWRMVKGLNDGVTDTTSRESGDGTLLPVALQARTVHLKNLPNLRRLMQLRHTVADLFKSFFFINETTADAVALRRVAEGYDFARAVATLNSHNKTLDAGFKVTVNAADGGQGKEKVLSELVEIIRFTGGELMSAARDLAPERAAFGDASILSGYARGLTPALLEQQAELLRGLAAQNRVMERPDWAQLKRVEPTFDFSALAADLGRIVEAVQAAGTVIKLLEQHRALDRLEADPRYRLLKAVHDMVLEVSDALRTMTQRQHLTGAQERISNEDREDCEEVYTLLAAELEG